MKHDQVVPDLAGGLFGDRLPLAVRYVEHLATTGVDWGLIGPREVPRLWERHVLNCAVVGELVPPGSRVIDLGSGAGLPGLPLALCRPDLQILLVEPLLRRAQWLEQVVADLALGQVEVRRARAEQLAGESAVPVVTARAVAPLDRLARWGLPLLGPGGALLAIKGRTAQQEVAETAAQVWRAGGVSTEILAVGGELLGEATTVVRVRVGDLGVSDSKVGASGRRPSPARPGSRSQPRRTSSE